MKTQADPSFCKGRKSSLYLSTLLTLPPPLLSLRVSYSLGKELPIFQGYVQPFKSFISFPNSLSKYLIQDSLISYLLDIYSNSGPKCEDPSKHTIIANRWVGVKKCPYLHIFEWTFTYYQKRL